MIFAYQVLMSDHAIAYTADAKVVHYHRYSNLQQLKRNFDLGVSQADHPEIFGKISSSAEGKKLVFETADYLRKNKKAGQIPGLYLTSFYKYLGYRLGKAYKKLPRPLVRKLTMNVNYWKKEA
ncbi:MAG: glycosyltransferase family 2 protein, partial [Lachnospiraceae bacterium]|nr:glycosyltransferase family 2 protein [Lachnospiraceae bacterium]